MPRMEMDWPVEAHSRSLVTVPEVWLHYDSSKLEAWKAAQVSFEKSGRKKYDCYQGDLFSRSEGVGFSLPSAEEAYQ